MKSYFNFSRTKTTVPFVTIHLYWFSVKLLRLHRQNGTAVKLNGILKRRLKQQRNE